MTTCKSADSGERDFPPRRCAQRPSPHTRPPISNMTWRGTFTFVYTLPAISRVSADVVSGPLLVGFAGSTSTAKSLPALSVSRSRRPNVSPPRSVVRPSSGTRSGRRVRLVPWYVSPLFCFSDESLPGLVECAQLVFSALAVRRYVVLLPSHVTCFRPLTSFHREILPLLTAIFTIDSPQPASGGEEAEDACHLES